MRKLATIRKVLAVKPIPNADAIELALIGGWQCVVKKGQFKEGDLGVYFEIDSFLPLEPKYEFLRASSFKTMGDDPGFRLRTVKFRGELSQGLLMPLSDFPNLPLDQYDVTSHLGIKLWEPPMPATLGGDIAGSFPSDTPKTDAERIQNLPDYFSSMADEEFEISEKINGTSISIHPAGICGRNWMLKEDEKNTYWRVGKLLLERVQKLNIAVQGELAGEGIQGNPLKIKGQRLFIFHIYDLATHRYFPPDVRREIAATLYQDNIHHVPLLNARIKIFQTYPTMEKLLAAADGQSWINSKVSREGIVCKSYNHPEICFKVVSNKYLLKENS